MPVDYNKKGYYIDKKTIERPLFEWTVDQREKRKKTGAV